MMKLFYRSFCEESIPETGNQAKRIKKKMDQNDVLIPFDPSDLIFIFLFWVFQYCFLVGFYPVPVRKLLTQGNG